MVDVGKVGQMRGVDLGRDARQLRADTRDVLT